MGVAKAVKRAGRDTNEGTVAAYISEDGKKAALLELSCETDFVGTNPKFVGFATKLAGVVAENNPADVDALKALPMAETTVADELTEQIHLFGENMKVLRFVARSTENGAFGSYIHNGGKIGVIVEFSFTKPETGASEEFKTFAHDVALHVAAVNPISARREDVPAETIEHEMGIYKAQAAESGKPEAIQERIAQGRMEKFYKESVLTEQEFVKNPDVTVGQLASQVSKSLGDTIEVVKFDRFEFGE
jgi:elongation factor Ts